MRQSTLTVMFGSMVVIFTFVMVTSIEQTTTAYADHVDRHIWIETAEGNFITRTETAIDDINQQTRQVYVTFTILQEVWNPDSEEIEIGEVNRKTNFRFKTPDGYDEYNKVKINNINVIQIGNCGDETTEKERVERLTTKEGFEQSAISGDGEYVSGEISPDEYKKFHENLCNYAYSNVVKSEYRYTIIDLPKDREIPPDYNSIVKAGVEAGLNRWGDINDIEFKHTDNRLEADIIIQQQIGDGTEYGNAEIGCLFDQQQCTIQLFTDINVNKRQTLTNKQSIEWTTAHEFGHLIGIPHHIEPDNIMNTIHDNNIRTYYETRNINIPAMSEQTYKQRLLGYEDSETYTTDDTSISTITQHEKFAEFVEYIAQVMRNTPQEDRLGLWWTITDEMFDRIENIVFNFN